MNEQFLAALQAENLPVSLDESLGRHTTFRIGGNADFFCVPATVTQLTRILELCRQYQVRTYLLGNGSNTLFSDAGFGGAVICLTGLNSRFSMQAQPDGSTKVLAPAGMMLSALCNTAQKESLAGLEFAFGIPGTVGGAAISEKHCGFVVNLGNATCADVVSLTEQVRQIVLEKTGCTLEREIRVVE